MILLLLPLIVIALGIVYFTQTHGYIGAVVLGLSTVGIDLFWQWLRFKVVHQGKPGRVIIGIIGGLIMRLLSIFLFMEFGNWWLGLKTKYFIAFAICLLLIPLVNIVVTMIFKQEKS